MLLKKDSRTNISKKMTKGYLVVSLGILAILIGHNLIKILG